MDLPETLTINAWTGEEQPASKVETGPWKRVRADQMGQPLAAPEPVDRRDWRHEKVGWGLVLPENEAISKTDRAAAADAPAPIRKLLDARPGSPVFRYRPDLHNASLRRYFPDGSEQDVALSGSLRGTGKGRLPWYLLLCGSPEALPWSLQYILNGAAYVGRLDLDETGLTRYVDALLNDWNGAACRPDRPVVWSVDHGGGDITSLMRRAIAEPVAKELRGDEQIGEANVRCLLAAEATATALRQALADARPALVVTTSHGMTGPLDDAEAMGRQLGFLVDDEHALLRPDELLQAWQPDGAIWYAHACCSAGSDARTRYQGLVEAGSSVERTLLAVAGLGARVAPLPKALMGAEKPLRAFVGHVEPTFDWTLRAATGQTLTGTIRQALYERMHREKPEPVGMAFEGAYKHAGELLAQWHELQPALLDSDKTRRDEARAAALRAQLTAADRQSMVILGDPTVALPPLG